MLYQQAKADVAMNYNVYNFVENMNWLLLLYIFLFNQIYYV